MTSLQRQVLIDVRDGIKHERQLTYLIVADLSILFPRQAIYAAIAALVARGYLRTSARGQVLHLTADGRLALDPLKELAL